MIAVAETSTADPPTEGSGASTGTPQSSQPRRRSVHWPEPRRCPTPSAIRAVRRDLHGETIDLGLGEPGWRWSAETQAAVEAGLAGRRWGYGPQAGESELRERIAEREGAQPEEVMVTVGAQGALFALTRAFLGPGDVALVPDPGFTAYPELVRQSGARPVSYPLPAAQGFELDANVLLAVLEAQPRTRMVILNHPANPTGAGASPEALALVAEVCRRRRILLVSDEVYRDLHRSGVAPVGGLRRVESDGIVVGSLSKAWAAPGLRVGWLVAPPPVVEACREVHAWAVTSAAGPSQAMATTLLGLGEAPLRESRHQLERRWREVESVWRSEVGGPCSFLGAGLYLWLPLPASASGDPRAFCARVQRQARVAGVPGIAFGEGGRGFVRFSLGGPVAEIGEGLRRWIRAGGLAS